MSNIDSLRNEFAQCLLGLSVHILPKNEYQFRCILRNGMEVNLEMRGQRWFNVRTNCDRNLSISPCAELIPAHDPSRISNLTPNCRFGHSMLFWKIRSKSDLKQLMDYVQEFDAVKNW